MARYHPLDRPQQRFPPLYAQVEAVLASDIAGGTLPPGSQLPTENDLIELGFGVRRPTVRRAVQNLVSRGLVEIHRGKGTYVTHLKITQELTKCTSGFVEDMQALGRQPTARLLGKQVVAADKTVAQQLALPAGSLVERIRRVRLADGEPVSFDETYLPREVGEKVITNDLEVEPIFSLLEERSTTCRSSRPSTGWKQWPRNPSWRRLSASKPGAHSS